MEHAFTDNDITSFLTQLIELGNVDTVDTSPDKYIRRISTGQPETITTEGKVMPLAVYGSRATDALIVNPFAEGSPDATKNIWFYSTRNAILSKNIVSILLYLLEIGANAKRNKTKDISDLKAAKYLAKYIADIDEKTLNEFQSLANNIAEFFTIYYNKGTRMGEVRCIVFSKEQRKTFDIRQKTWKMLEGLTLEILDATSLSDFNYETSSLMAVPVFESFANILVNVYSHIKEPLKMVEVDVKVEPIKSHLKYIQEYQSKAAWCQSPTSVAPSTATPLPWGVPMPTAAVPMPVAPVPMPGVMTTMVPQPVSAYPYGMQAYGVGLAPGMVPVNAGIPMPGACPPQLGIPVPIPAVTKTEEATTKSTGNPFVQKM